MTIVDQISLILLLVLTAVASYKDIKTSKIPNWIPITLFVGWIALIIIKWILADMHILEIAVFDVFITCAKQVLSSAIIVCVLAASIVIANKRRKRLGQESKSVFGMGDVKLLMVTCLYFGFIGSFACIIFACLSFIIYIFIKRMATDITISSAPFAPFILIGDLFSVIIIYFVI